VQISTHVITKFQIFGPFEAALRGRRLASDDEVKDAVNTRLPAQPKTFFAVGMRKFVDRSKKMCREARGLRQKI
jgi:hypothetical protein